MLSAFKIKSYDLEPVFAAWKDAPIFLGIPKKDKLTVDKWLDAIKAGCVERSVPDTYWHKVGQHYMGPAARARLDELKLIMGKVHGGKYRWTWKKFKVAMMNMGWEIDATATEPLQLRKSPLGLWWVRRKKEDPEEFVVVPSSTTPASPPSPSSPDRPSLLKSHTIDVATSSHPSFWPGLRNSVMKSNNSSGTSTPAERAGRPRFPSVKSATVDSSGDNFWNNLSSNLNLNSKNKTSDSTTPGDIKALPSLPPSAKSDTHILQAAKAPTDGPLAPGEVTTITHAPTWLLNASSALDFLSGEHPKAMTALSAILITVGTIPAMPIVASGGAGVILASSAAQAIGAIAVGVGSWLKAQQEGQVTVSTNNASAPAAALK